MTEPVMVVQRVASREPWAGSHVGYECSGCSEPVWISASGFEIYTTRGPMLLVCAECSGMTGEMALAAILGGVAEPLTQKQTEELHWRRVLGDS